MPLRLLATLRASERNVSVVEVMEEFAAGRTDFIRHFPTSVCMKANPCLTHSNVPQKLYNVKQAERQLATSFFFAVEIT